MSFNTKRLEICMTSLLFFLMSLVVTSAVKAQTEVSHPSRVLFISQVRGTECCDVGSLEMLEEQIGFFNENELSASFAVRYDALVDPEFQKLFLSLDPDRFELGAFLEITPELAKVSGVDYLGTSDNWYQAQHAYPIGYKLEDRKKLIDTVMQQFYKNFGRYPAFTAGWMVDTETLNYLREQYGTTIHEMTREQWGTDSYTLSGGPFHYPYFARRDWAFLPSTEPSQTGKNQTLILRQTVSDPLRNYADMNSTFTSQPNDYIRDGKNFDYFRKLMNQMLNQRQQPYSFALLGLENSMGDAHTQEFGKQIQYIRELRAEKPEMAVLTASQFFSEYKAHWPGEKVVGVVGKDLIEENGEQTEDSSVVWVTTAKYRARLLRIGQKVMITDFRMYPSEIADPYTQKIATNLGFWVSPFLVDGSRFYDSHIIDARAPSGVKERVLNWLGRRTLPEFRHKTQKILPIQPDYLQESTPAHIKLPDITSTEWEVEHAENTIIITYQSLDGKNAELKFLEDQFLVQTAQAEKAVSLETALHPSLPFIQLRKDRDNTLLEWVTGDKDNTSPILALVQTCPTQASCTFEPNVASTAQWEKARAEYYPYLFPEFVSREIDGDQSVLYAHNPFAVAGKNPIRFVLIPKDEFGYPTFSNDQPSVTADPHLLDYSVTPQDGGAGNIFIDIVDNRIGRYVVTVKYGDLIKKETVYFAPNCKVKKVYCLQHPVQGMWYLKSMFYTIVRQSTRLSPQETLKKD